MTTTHQEMVDVLLHGVIKFAPAKPFTHKGFYADLSLLTDRGDIRITGDARDMSDGGEAFFLTLYEFDQKRYWVDKETGLPSWPPSKDRGWNAVDLAEEWRTIGIPVHEPRTVRFYRDAEDVTRGLPPTGPLQSAAAIKFIFGPSPKHEIVVYATYDSPFAVEISADNSTSRAILDKLEEFYPL